RRMHRAARRAGGSGLGRRRRGRRRHAVRVHLQPARQDRGRWRASAPAHRPGRRLHAADPPSLKSTSLSLRLTAWFSAIFLGGFVLFGVIMWIDLAYSLSQGRDRTLTRRAARFVELLEATRHEAPAGREARFAQLADVIPEGNLIQVFDRSGKR